MCTFRDLRADEVECRIGQVNKDGKGLSLLLYKDARCDMNILDETVGTLNWQREHYEVKGRMYCRVSIWDEARNQWVWKADCGTESNTEAEKGEASDSFKRACVNWGIGRELYTAPRIWISANMCKIENGKCYDRFDVVDMVVRNKVIVGLTISRTDKKGECIIAYTYGEHRQTPQNRSQQPQAQPLPTTPQPQQNAAQPNVAHPTPRKRLMQLLEARNIDVQQYMTANNLSKTTPESEVERMIKELEQLPPVPSDVA